VDTLTPGDKREAGPGPGASGPAARSAGLAARDSYGRLLALLAASTSDLAAAEDALAQIDDVDVDSIPDRRLELMLVCAHPAIGRTPLMLNTVLAFTAEQVGRAFSMPRSTMATRLVRAKKRIKAAGIPFRIPDRADLPARMTSVLEAIYGAYVIDWASGPQARPLPPEALHLAEVLTTLVPGDPEARGLAALIELSVARAPARVDAGGRFVPLADQDPSLWNPYLISRAHEHLAAAHAQGQLGRFQLEAAIQAVHCARVRDGAADWPTLLTLHRILQAVAPSLGSGVALAAVTAEVDGPAAGLATLDALLTEAGEGARRFQPAQATRAHLLARLNRKEEAVAAYDSAISLTHDPAERQYLERRRGQL
jgi:predicted RNA polymerase sigma factor